MRFFKSLFYAVFPWAAKRIPVMVTAYSQPEVLQNKMQNAELKHGQTATVTMSDVYLDKNKQNKAEIRFCNMGSLVIHDKNEIEFAGEIPKAVQVNDLFIPENFKPGFYKLQNVNLHSNGQITVTATEKTKLEFAKD